MRPAIPIFLAGAILAVGVLGTVRFALGAEPAQTAAPNNDSVEAGAILFTKNCAFCHGKDAQGGETGPDLLSSPLVLADSRGEKIAAVVREGRYGTPMPAFTFTSVEILEITTYIHELGAKLTRAPGDRGSVSVADLQTGNRQTGEKYFKGHCAKCHSATGDLAGIATRYQGLQLEQRMLYPNHVKSRVTITTASRQMTGQLEYMDEFTIGMREDDGTYHSWRIPDVHYSLEQPLAQHQLMLGLYSDADVHNLMAFLQSIR